MLADAIIQTEWLHSENEGSLQTSEGTIYEFPLRQKIGSLSAQKGSLVCWNGTIMISLLDADFVWCWKSVEHTTKMNRNHTEISDPPLAIKMPKYMTYKTKQQ
jgi:hypothetical protein